MKQHRRAHLLLGITLAVLAVTEGGYAEEHGDPAASDSSSITNEYVPIAGVDSGRQTGDIVELLSDGKTYLITAGSLQGMEPGVRLDVHRPLDNSFLYAGRLQVVNVLSGEFSMAEIVPEESVDICPVTGRVVRSGTDNSPFVTTAAGEPVRLKNVDPSDRLPAIGDAVDIPF